MLACIIAYFVTFFATLLVSGIIRIKVEDFPSLELKRDGLVFVSHMKHRLRLYGAKVLQVEQNVYLKKNNKLVCVQNVDRVFVRNDYLYFQGIGEVKIKFNCSKIYKYFSMDIESKFLDMQKNKRIALIDIKNHVFDFKNAFFLKKYLKILKHIFKINISNRKIVIKQNEYKLPFVINYCSKGKKKRIKVN